LKIFVVFGTRPEAIKFAPLIYRLKERFSIRIISSGQHSELLTQALEFFNITPDYSFGCMSKNAGLDLENLYECIHREMRVAIDKEDPDLIFVHGDTFSTYSACFVGYLLKKPVFHLEAGLRTFRKFSPFPEEMLRVLVSRIADIHFAPTERAGKNLLAEGVDKDRIFVTGNTIVDAQFLAEKLMDEETVLKELTSERNDIQDLLKDRKLVLVTSHRRENIGEPLKQICRTIKHLAKAHPDTSFLWPLHKNPRVRDIVSVEMAMADRPENIVLTETLAYQAMLYLIKKSFIIMSDSGGIQEEAPTFGKPVIILRDATETPEVLDAGIGFLVGSVKEKITKVFLRLYHDSTLRETIAGIPNPFGDGNASEKIVQFLMRDDIRAFVENYDSHDHYNGNDLKPVKNLKGENV
jgi:UDP-N-acetylglucosamine 2-epimerase (non-hydrolysing)